MTEYEYLIDPLSYGDKVTHVNGTPVVLPTSLTIADLPTFDADRFKLETSAGNPILIYYGKNPVSVQANNTESGAYLVGVRPVRKPRPTCPNPLPTPAPPIL